MSAYYPSSSYENEPSTPDEAPATSPQPFVSTINPGDVSAAVRNLLTSTKRLQEVLRLWSVEQATEAEVSDLYVQIGHEFNQTISAFAHHGIDLSDLHDIPNELRAVLEHCLSEYPSPEILDRFIPDLRRVLFRLLKGLQSRQEQWHKVLERLSAASNH